MTAEYSLPLFDALLLAGGQSRRMGRDKAGIVVRGQPLWRRQLETLRATRPEAVFVSGPPHGPYAGGDCEVIADATSGLGPLAGLSAGFRRTKAPWLLVLAIDLPRITSAFLAGLLRQAALEGRGLVPVEDEHLHPLAAVYPGLCGPLVDECLSRGHHSVQAFVTLAEERGMIRQHPIGAEERVLFENINTPEDLDRLQRVGE